MSTVPSPKLNRLIAALPDPDYDSVAAHLERVALPLGHMLYEPHVQLEHAYFPTTAVVSLHYVMESGASAETAAVGNEGMVGVSLFMGGETMPSSAVVQAAGHAYRLERRLLEREFRRAGYLQRLLLRYAQALMTQVAQTAACNRHHTVEQRLSRWLLVALDHASSSELIVTHELMAGMLGVRREGVTEAARRLQTAGCIDYRRGHITVMDRARLETHSCECYAVVRMEMARLLSDVQHRQSAEA